MRHVDRDAEFVLGTDRRTADDDIPNQNPGGPRCFTHVEGRGVAIHLCG
jgi:hypothetical protein